MKAPPAAGLELDHLVVAARTLAEGVAWCEATLGVTPEAGGEHHWMGTHNRLLNIGSPPFPRAYLEIIAINPQAPAPARPRWFDLDQASMHEALARAPRLIHWAARCPDASAISTISAAWRAAGVERGECVAAERQTPGGMLRWRITVRADGQRLFDGALPTLIEWTGVHPTHTLPDRQVALSRVAVRGLPAVVAAGLPATISTASSNGAAPLSVTLTTPRGPVTLDSPPTLHPSPDHVQP